MKVKKISAKAALNSSKKVLILRSNNPNLKSHGGFQWPESGPVECPDWDPQAECGTGLHGFLWGQGNMSLSKRSHDAKWLVVEVNTDDIVNLDGKVKFPKGNVIYCGTWWTACAIVRQEYLKRPVKKQKRKIATGRFGHAAATGRFGHAAATGDSGHAAATGDSAVAASLNNRGHAKAGENGTIIIAWIETSSIRRRIAVGYVGENGIKADTWYRVAQGKLQEVTMKTKEPDTTPSKTDSP